MYSSHRYKYSRRFCNNGICNFPLSVLHGVRRCACEIIRKQLFCSFSRMFIFVVEVLNTVAAAYYKCGRLNAV